MAADTASHSEFMLFTSPHVDRLYTRSEIIISVIDLYGCLPVSALYPRVASERVSALAHIIIGYRVLCAGIGACTMHGDDQGSYFIRDELASLIYLFHQHCLHPIPRECQDLLATD